MRRIGQGFTLVELMIIVAIIAILAAVAIPAYQEYTVRAKVAELVAAMGGFKATISDKAFSDSTLASSGIGLTVASSGRISGGSVADAGVITIQGNNTTVGTIVTVVLSPSIGFGRMNWSCGTSGNSSIWKYVPAECRH